MNKIQVNDSATLKELYDENALTWEGLNTTDENLNRMIDWIKQYTPLKKEDVYIINGSLMNTTYGLTGENSYNDDIHIVCVKLNDMVDFNKITLPRFDVGGRWFDDIVDNNERREKEKQ